MKHPIEIRDPQIDTEAVMARIRENLRGRPATGLDLAALPTFDVDSVIQVDDEVLDYHLEQAASSADKVWPELSLAPSWATQLPIVGRFWRMIREQAHRLVLYYVEMAASKQVGFNEHVVGSLQRLAAMQQEMALLRQEIVALKQQLAALQAERRDGE
jgi:hypothetical protein